MGQFSSYLLPAYFQIPKQMRPLQIFICLAFFTVPAFSQNKFYLDELHNIEKIETGWGQPKRKTNMSDMPISLKGKVYERGICLHAYSQFSLQLDGKAKKFHCLFGLDDKVAKLGGHSVRIKIFNQEKLIWKTDSLGPGQEPMEVNLDLTNFKIIRFEIEGFPGTWHTHCDLADAWIEYGGEKPFLFERPMEKAEILSPKPGPLPRITGPKVFGLRPGSPILFRFTGTGEKPIRFSAQALPQGLSLNPETGQLSGTVAQAGEYEIEITASNAKGKTSRKWKLKVADLLALTPPMGWNSWNCWGMSVDEDKVMQSASAMVSSGLADHGWTYINIDDGWQGEKRNPRTGIIESDPKKFPDMKKLSDQVHGLGLKIGLYSSPGKLTCGKRLGSLAHEEIDAKTYADWGYDYLKYDYCSYGQIYDFRYEKTYDVMRPYQIMRDALKDQKRDIVYSLCQYGEHQIWNHGEKLNGNLWRTTGDIIDTWNSMRVIGFKQMDAAPFTKPGRWADPDMLVVGKVGWGPNLHPTRLSPNEQYTHISLWCMLSAPLLLGCDLAALDDFTLNLLTNDEVLDINQDPLGIQAVAVNKDGMKPIYLKKLENGDYALAVFNLSETEQICQIQLNDLGLAGKFAFRDVWRQKDVKTNGLSWTGKVPVHGVMMFRIRKP